MVRLGIFVGMLSLCGAVTEAPTPRPTKTPTTAPTQRPTKVPTMQPTFRPTKTPTTARPTKTPVTWRPTKKPTAAPTGKPVTPQPTVTPTAAPTQQVVPECRCYIDQYGCIGACGYSASWCYMCSPGQTSGCTNYGESACYVTYYNKFAAAEVACGEQMCSMGKNGNGNDAANSFYDECMYGVNGARTQFDVDRQQC